MRRTIAAGAFFLLCSMAAAQFSSDPRIPHKSAQIANGKYIVENVAMCSSCHTPRLPNGEFVKSKTLMGSHLAFKVPATGRWASEAPQIAGLPRWEDEEIVILLKTGKLETGLSMRPPMPEFHMTDHDARAVVAYLRSLVPPPKRGARFRAFNAAASTAAK